MVGNWLETSMLMAVAGEYPATAEMMIMNPRLGGAIAGRSSTHPDTGEPVARLRVLVRGAGAY